jgi:selenocysteine-specific elongation factor
MIRLHVGTAEVTGRVYLLEGKKVEPGQRTFVQFRLVEPVVVAPSDRYVLRSYSPMETIGGGEILDHSRWRLKAGKDFIIDELRGKQSSLGDCRKLLEHMITSAGYEAVPEREVAVRIGQPLEETRRLVGELVEAGRIRRASRAGMLLAVERLEEAKSAARRIAQDYYKEFPRRLLMDKAFLRQALRTHEVFLQDLLAEMEAAGEIEGRPGGQIRWRDFGPRLSAEDEERRRVISSSCLGQPFTPPSPAELAQAEGWDPARTAEVFELLAEEGDLCKVAEGIFFHRQAMEDARERLREHLLERGSMTASDAKKLLESTRKYSIPLLEQFDREGFTVRRGDVRELRQGHASL